MFKLVIAGLGGGCLGFAAIRAALQGNWEVCLLALGIWFVWMNLMAWVSETG